MCYERMRKIIQYRKLVLQNSVVNRFFRFSYNIYNVPILLYYNINIICNMSTYIIIHKTQKYGLYVHYILRRQYITIVSIHTGIIILSQYLPNRLGI